MHTHRHTYTQRIIDVTSLTKYLKVLPNTKDINLDHITPASDDKGALMIPGAALVSIWCPVFKNIIVEKVNTP